MNKRSAMLMAAGLVIALAVGAAATSFSLDTTASADGGSGAKPIVKTVRDTVTVHKEARRSNDGPTVVTLQASSGDAADDLDDALDDVMEGDDHDEDPDDAEDDDEHDEDAEDDDEHDEDAEDDDEHDEERDDD